MYLIEQDDEHVDPLLGLVSRLKCLFSFFNNEHFSNLQWLLLMRYEWKEVFEKGLEIQHFLIHLKRPLTTFEEYVYY